MIPVLVKSVWLRNTVNSFNFVGTNFRGLGKKAFRGIVKFVDCRLQKKKGVEILKFVDFHFQIRRFCVSQFYGKVFKFTSTPNKYGSLLYIISLLQF